MVSGVETRAFGVGSIGGLAVGEYRMGSFHPVSFLIYLICLTRLDISEILKIILGKGLICSGDQEHNFSIDAHIGIPPMD